MYNLFDHVWFKSTFVYNQAISTTAHSESNKKLIKLLVICVGSVAYGKIDLIDEEIRQRYPNDIPNTIRYSVIQKKLKPLHWI